jgi:COP9 signalosome complex subunit 3
MAPSTAVIGIVTACKENRPVPQILSMLNSSEQELESSWEDLSVLLAELHLVQHSLPCSFFLSAIGGHNLNEEQEKFFLDTAHRFLLCADSVQVKLAPAKFASVCRKYKDIHVRLGSSRCAISPLQSAVQRLQPSPGVLTPVHADLLQVCLLSKFYGLALPLVEQTLGIVDPKLTGLKVKDFLLYCYYGGMVLVGEKQFSKALEFFLNALTVPAAALSAIMIASYKKYILVSLLLHGDLPPIPEYTSPVVRRTIGNHCRNTWTFSKPSQTST